MNFSSDSKTAIHTQIRNTQVTIFEQLNNLSAH